MPEIPKKPLHKPNRTTANTHIRQPLDVLTAGKRFRVRDRLDADGSFKMWGEDLDYTAAFKLKETVCANRKSKTARVEEMPMYSGPGADPGETEAYQEAARRVVQVSPERLANDPLYQTYVPTSEDGDIVGEGIASKLPPPDSFNKASSDQTLEAARQRAVAAAAPAAHKAQLKADAKKVVMADPPKPPPSPLTDEILDDIPEIPEDAVPDAGELQDMIADVGGGPADDDKKHAVEAAEISVAEQLTLAQTAYETAVCQTRHPDTWPQWGELGEFEIAAWRYYVMNGGTRPELTRVMKKPTHAMHKNTEVS